MVASPIVIVDPFNFPGVPGEVHSQEELTAILQRIPYPYVLGLEGSFARVGLVVGELVPSEMAPLEVNYEITEITKQIPEADGAELCWIRRRLEALRGAPGAAGRQAQIGTLIEAAIRERRKRPCLGAKHMGGI